MAANSTKKTTSIARRIHWGFWFSRLWGVILFDIVLAGIISVSFFFYFMDNAKLPEGSHIVSQTIETRDKEDTDVVALDLVFIDNHGEKYPYELNEYAELMRNPVFALLSFECLYLFLSLFGTGRIRRKLRPLNELAKQAEVIREVSLDPAKMHNLEMAIEHVNPDSPQVSIGDKDLLSIEIALNNLLTQMKESEKAKTRFVSDASHELRTPIAVIQGYVNMLDRWGKEDEEILAESIEALKNESEHMKELVEQLLFLARGDSGRNKLNKVKLNMSEVINEVYEESVMIDEEHVYKCKCEENLFIYGDSAMIKQSVRIFVQNAAKYSHKGDTISFRVKANAGRIEYHIQDEGIGMNDSQVGHIFERFYRSDEARNSETGGSGLGLSIAKWIVDSHDGNIEVISVPELGTRFVISFPEYSGQADINEENVVD